MEHVLEGVRLSYGHLEPGGSEGGPRVWLGGVTFTAVQVSVLHDEEQSLIPHGRTS